MNITDNYRKHTANNPLQKLLINNFYTSLVKLTKTIEVSSILDVGCGEGFTLHKFQVENIGKKREGLEYSSSAISLAKKTYPDVHITQGSIYELPYKANTFDLVVCTEVLEHLENPQEALSELVRVSKKYCLFSVPHEPLFMLANFIRGKNLAHFGNDREHIQHWTQQGFKRFIETKLEVVTTVSPFPWTMVLAKK